MILHDETFRDGARELRRVVSYSPGPDGRGLIEIESRDNYDDVGRPPCRHEHERVALQDFLRGGENDPAVRAYHRLVAEGLITPAE